MKDLAAGLNAKFKFTYTSLIFVVCDAEPVTRGIGSGGVMHTNQIKPVQAVRTSACPVRKFPFSSPFSSP